jgi:hypothetical protein
MGSSNQFAQEDELSKNYGQYLNFVCSCCLKVPTINRKLKNNHKRKISDFLTQTQAWFALTFMSTGLCNYLTQTSEIFLLLCWEVYVYCKILQVICLWLFGRVSVYRVAIADKDTGRGQGAEAAGGSQHYHYADDATMLQRIVIWNCQMVLNYQCHQMTTFWLWKMPYRMVSSVNV